MQKRMILGIYICLMFQMVQPMDLSLAGFLAETKTKLITSVHQFFTSETAVKDSFTPLFLPCMGGAAFSFLARDTYQTIGNSVRLFCAGSLLVAGMHELYNTIASTEYKSSAVGLALCLAGGLLCSQKDIKTVLGMTKGYSLNPPAEVKKEIAHKRKKGLSLDNCTIPHDVVQCAEEGRIAGLPLIVRFFTTTTKDVIPTARRHTFNESEVITTILPYLRSFVPPEQIKQEGMVDVFSGDDKKRVSLNAGVIYCFMSHAHYKATEKEPENSK